MHDLIEDVFLGSFDNAVLATLEDSGAVLARRFWPGTATGWPSRPTLRRQAARVSGGDIGKLAVCGTVNDLAVGGAIR